MADPSLTSRGLYGRLVFGVFGLAAVFGFYMAGDLLRDYLVARRADADTPGGGGYIPWSARPGPPRREDPVHQLDPADPAVVTLTGQNDAIHERWADISGNYYSADFVRGFDYAKPGEDGPRVLLRYARSGPSFRGRIEARNLKPHFAYQIKVLGDYRHPDAFDRIGYTGRWRLPGSGTNYSDAEAQAYPDKSQVEAYLFFDFFITDAQGNAVREFDQDHSLHVLWNEERNFTSPDDASHRVIRLVSPAQNPDAYMNPMKRPYTEYIFAEREHARYRSDSPRRLPPGDYPCYLILTEESWHSKDRDGGWWATVYKEPIHFTITAPGAAPAPAP